MTECSTESQTSQVQRRREESGNLVRPDLKSGQHQLEPQPEEINLMIIDRERLPVNTDSGVKLAGQRKDSEVRHEARPQDKQVNEKTEENHPDLSTDDRMVRAELEWIVPMCVPLPIEVLNHDQAFPFLNTTLTDLGIDESAVKERVVWVDSKRTRVKGRTGKLKEKEVMVLEVRVKAQRPGEHQSQEVIYSTESNTDRSFCRSGVDILPWRHTDTAELQPVEMILAIDTLSESKL